MRNLSFLTVPKLSAPKLSAPRSLASCFSVTSLSVACAALISMACSGQDSLAEQPVTTGELLGGSSAAPTSSSATSTSVVSTGTTTTTTAAPTTLAPTTSTAPVTTTAATTSTSNDEEATTEEEDVSPNASEDPIQSDVSPTATATSTAMMSTEECTDNPDPEQTCQQRKEWDNCNQQWMIDGQFCNRTCGRCGGGGGEDTGSNTSGGGTTTGNQTTQDPGDNPYAPLNGQGTGGVTTRYWDCCKPSCGWSGKGGRIIDSCNLSDNNIGANDQNRSVCDGGDAQTCHGMSPMKHSNSLAYAYAAINGATCGNCYQVEFTGTANGGQMGDEGSMRLKGKTLVVMATNIGDIGANHFDLLIPGGGLGAMTQGCPRALGLNADELGATRGGFRTTCASSGSQDAIKECVKNKCTQVFGGKGLTELEAGCLWYADWFEAADNPDMVYKQLPECPAELSSFF